MPVRSLGSSVLRWPDAQTVDRAVRDWARRAVRRRPDVTRIGYFGSYSRGDWSVGSDLDLIVVVRASDQPFEKRASQWDATDLPVPTDVLVYTVDELRSMSGDTGFGATLMREAVWIYSQNEDRDQA